MGEKSTSGGKSTLVQAPQKTSAPISTSTKGGGFVKSQKNKKVMTAGDFQMATVPKASVKSSYAYAPENPYPKLTRNDKCGCGSGIKYKKCCFYKTKTII